MIECNLMSAESALGFISPCDREVWVRMGMAIHGEFGQAGFEVWDNWSSMDEDGYRSADARAVWRSFKPGAISIRSLFAVALANGWKPDRERAAIGRHPIDPTELARIALEREQAEIVRIKRAESASVIAQRLNAVSEAASSDHPYLMRKNIQPVGLRQRKDVSSIIGYVPKVDGQPLIGVLLIVPLRSVETGELLSAQLIDMDGRKSFLSGGKARGTAFAVGICDKPEQLIVCEGVATGASLHAELALPVWCALSAGNLKPVALALRAKYRDVDIVIAGDNDASGTGQREAEAAALAVHGSVSLPPDVGQDWNDHFNAIQEAA